MIINEYTIHISSVSSYSQTEKVEFSVGYHHNMIIVDKKIEKQ